MAKAFRDLQVWQRAMDLTTNIYQLTAIFPITEIYGLTTQMRRAAVSIASNIAEGSGRNTRRDFRSFVAIAQGSNRYQQNASRLPSSLSQPQIPGLKLTTKTNN